MVIQEDVVPIGPQTRLRTQECPNLIERMPPHVPNPPNRNLSPDSRQHSRRNHLYLY